MFIPNNLEDLKRVVEERVEETTGLEFKRELPSPGKNDDLAQDLCALANTEGGVIVYGIDQDEMGRAKALFPFPVSGGAERINLVAHSRIDEPLTVGSVSTIQSEGQQGRGFLVVEVPPSERAPHFFQGTAWGRTSKGNVRLTRRRVGELFARSTGFAKEFGLALGRPGRLLVQQVAEPYQETDTRGQLRTKRRHYLLFKNDGDAEVAEAAWEWVLAEGTDAPLPHVVEDPFPLDVLQPGVEVRIPVLLVMGTAMNLRIRTRWRDKNGKQHEQTWPVTW